jgi:hypothetical protein
MPNFNEDASASTSVAFVQSINNKINIDTAISEESIRTIRNGLVLFFFCSALSAFIISLVSDNGINALIFIGLSFLSVIICQILLYINCLPFPEESIRNTRNVLVAFSIASAFGSFVAYLFVDAQNQAFVFLALVPIFWILFELLIIWLRYKHGNILPEKEIKQIILEEEFNHKIANPKPNDVLIAIKPKQVEMVPIAKPVDKASARYWDFVKSKT